MRPFPLILAPTERMVWEGDRQRTFCQHAVTIVTVAVSLATASAFSTVIAGLAYKAVAAVACVLIVVSAFAHSSRLPKRFVLTSHRIVELDRDGKCLWRDGCHLSRQQEANIRRGPCGWTVAVSTVQMDHGDPETVRVGPLYRTEAKKLVKLLPTVALEAQAW